MAELAGQPKLLAGINLTLVMSHLIVSEEQDNPLNRKQLATFKDAVRQLGLSAKPHSLAASSGIFLGPEYRFQMMRPGRLALRPEPADQPAEPDAPSR